MWFKFSPSDRHSSYTAEGRMIAWRVALELMLEKSPLPRKIFGHGCYSNVFAASARYYGTKAPVTQYGAEFAHVHNVVLQTWVESGLMGMLAGALLWLIPLRAASQKSSDREQFDPKAFFPAILTIGLMSQFDDVRLPKAGPYSWMLLGITIAAQRNGRLRDRTDGCMSIRLKPFEKLVFD